ncbi:hypothetical protein LCGC14_0622600 [marine sediment metagenome]|uniref:Tyr recombinase domain-containing protein n=1 Tax=marine sediment metagenome TaxID=412755 RepID=A0A0F9R9D1_9ZZZZ
MEAQPHEKQLGESISLDLKSHRHDYQKIDSSGLLTCSCGKQVLDLKRGEKEGLLIGVKSDGKKYTVRDDRRRYFFPDEWISFISVFEEKHKKHIFFYKGSLYSGGRVMEVLHWKHKDIDVERQSINFNTVKQRKAKKNFFAAGKSRKFLVSDNFIKAYKSLIRGTTPNPEHYIFLDNEKLPEGYSDLSNAEKKKYYEVKKVAYSRMLKRKLKKAGLPEHEFSLHNIRKTYGMWMRVLGIEIAEICYRLGHDMDTYLAHYGSSLIFNDVERRKIAKIMGEVK